MNILGTIAIIILVIMIFSISQSYKQVSKLLELSERRNTQLRNKIESEISYYEKQSEYALNVLENSDNDAPGNIESDLVVKVLKGL